MVEVPAAALAAEVFAPEVDFFSIGTNDLTQYTLAAERGNERLAELRRCAPPLRLAPDSRPSRSRLSVSGKWVGVCGELASEPLAVPALVGLGVTELSVNPPAIPSVRKRCVRSTSARLRHSRARRCAWRPPTRFARSSPEKQRRSPGRGRRRRDRTAGRSRLDSPRHHLGPHPARAGRRGADPARPRPEHRVHSRRRSASRSPARRTSSTATSRAAGRRRRPSARSSTRRPTSCSSRARSSPSSTSVEPLRGLR